MQSLYKADIPSMVAMLILLWIQFDLVGGTPAECPQNEFWDEFEDRCSRCIKGVCRVYKSEFPAPCLCLCEPDSDSCKSEKIVEDKSTPFPVLEVVLPIVAFLIIITILISCFVYRRCNRGNDYTMTASAESPPQVLSETNIPNVNGRTEPRNSDPEVRNMASPSESTDTNGGISSNEESTGPQRGPYRQEGLPDPTQQVVRS